MKFKWWGHAAFSITLADGTVILTDPYGEDFGYKQIDIEPDIVTISHDHFDHNGSDSLPGDYKIINSVDKYENDNIVIKGIPTFHDQSQGSERGENIIFKMQLEDKIVTHTGDLGHELKEEKIDLLADTDILLVPVGGTYTIDGNKAYNLVQDIEPTVVFPMHYKTDKIELPIMGVESFTNNYNEDEKENIIRRIKKSEVEIMDLPLELNVYILDYVS